MAMISGPYSPPFAHSTALISLLALFLTHLGVLDPIQISWAVLRSEKTPSFLLECSDAWYIIVDCRGCRSMSLHPIRQLRHRRGWQMSSGCSSIDIFSSYASHRTWYRTRRRRRQRLQRRSRNNGDMSFVATEVRPSDLCHRPLLPSKLCFDSRQLLQNRQVHRQLSPLKSRVARFLRR